MAEDFERARRNTEMKKGILYDGVKADLIKDARRG
jgi:hypothetical protein